VAELKQVVYDLRPPTLDALGLVPSLRRYAERFKEYSGIPCDVRAEGESFRLPPDMEIGLYRIMQEALQNVSAHAAAQRAEVAIGFSSQAITLGIADDGRGFDREAVAGDEAGHFGIMGMRERAESLGGELAIETGSGRGTRVSVSVPVPSALVMPEARTRAHQLDFTR
jgi:two-component system sensor histidine kinase DegS